MSKELSEETKYEFNVFARQLNKDLTNLMEYLRQQDKDNKPILYVGRHLKKVILPYDEYQKMCQRLETIDNSNPSEALEKLDKVSNYLNDVYDYIEIKEEVRKDIDTIKQSLLKSQEQEKVLEILKEKRVDLSYLRCCIEDNQSVERYNEYIRNKTMDYDHEEELTEEEFNLLKRYFK